MDGTNGAAQHDPLSLEYAQAMDRKDDLRSFRDQFIFPSKADLKRQTMQKPPPSSPEAAAEDESDSIYLCGNSLGLQPRAVQSYVSSHLTLWSRRGVYGHFTPATDALIPPWLDLDDAVKAPMAKLVGALASEVAIMETLTANLHLLMCSFYRPTAARYKIILEGKAFPSDHYVVESQARMHGFDPADAMVLLEPPDPAKSLLLPTDYICGVIDRHADAAAVLLLPGIQFYTGQLFDIQRITRHAQSRGLVVGWDLAHAVGNVPLQLHEWQVDFAAWCTYKYLNCGPGAMGGLFVHDRHTTANGSASNGTASGESAPASASSSGSPSPHAAYRPRLAGWWGSDKASRFAMTNVFTPIPGAGGFQLSNPSALDLSAVMASLSVFEQTSIEALRRKSLELTAYLEKLLLSTPNGEEGGKSYFEIITPSDPARRGSQLSLKLLHGGLLDGVMHALERRGVVVDERRPEVIRVAPAPLYNSWEDAWRFARIFREACREAASGGGSRSEIA